MIDLFDETSIKSMKLTNRFVRSATWSGMANDNGEVTPKLTKLMTNYAKGGVDFIISGYAYVLRNGQSVPRQLAIYNDTFVPGLSQMVNDIHDAGGKIAAQIVHGGVHSVPQMTGESAMGPSEIPAQEGAFGPFPGCRTMTQEDIDSVVNGFREAAIRAKKVGFDGIQLHGAHGYLFSQFLSPFYNKRTDNYGGSLTNRTRIVTDTYEQVRNEAGDNYPVMIKMNVNDFMDDGILAEDAIEAASIYSNIGIDAIELSGGTAWGLNVLGDFNRFCCRTANDEAYYRDISHRIKKKVNTPIILTGGFRSYERSEQIIQDGISDYIGLCRPLIREPDLVNRWKSGDTTKSGCVSDNACALGLFEGKDLECVHHTVNKKP